MIVWVVVGRGHSLYAVCATKEQAFLAASKLRGGESAYGVEDWVVIDGLLDSELVSAAEVAS